ncbi:hypothetical protein [Mesoplasma lactucae]|uniref:Uncharacterized protein n=1 Tax=Mesoplasma lactucae ATCC 49193 TaxID=81460 RepID=A0A291IS37_9MOLU|nr:hypothetical protein [Mesoplasma lactucae]ATG97501.1 hypothetical protein CP520_01905 [Mesoplasma lactucae ATCC 49193]ATZ20043.1 hypothetical protein MLACT_v1c02210 [Mesoplasma lactucae ATCC 49193]MCL8217006.1 hypothetical protein [Mesoplasma lactucae ATCC 49193]
MKETNRYQKFVVYEEFDELVETKESFDLLNALIKTNLNKFDWKNLTTDNSTFNQVLEAKNNKSVIYKVSKQSLVNNEKYGILLLSINNKTKFLSSEVKEIQFNYLTNEIIYLKTHLFNYWEDGKETEMYIEFINEEKLTFNLIKLNNNNEEKMNEEQRKRFIDKFGLNDNYETLPFVLWRTNDLDEDEFSHQRNLARHLEFVQKILTDQLLNSMVKKEAIFSDMDSNQETEDHGLREFTDLKIDRISSLDPNYRATNALYQPNNQIKNFMDYYDWQMKNIFNLSGIKNKSDSKEETNVSMFDIDNTINQFKTNIKQMVIKLNKNLGNDVLNEPNIILDLKENRTEVIKNDEN